MKKLFHDPKFYADLALCAVMIIAIAIATGKSLPQLGREAWAAVANITGEGTQSALAQFTATNTIGNATVSQTGWISSASSGTFFIGNNFVCFLSGIDQSIGGGFGSCEVTGSIGSWSMSIHDGPVQCKATCIN